MSESWDYSSFDAATTGAQSSSGDGWDYSGFDHVASAVSGTDAAKKRDEWYRSTYGDSVLPALGNDPNETQQSSLSKFIDTPLTIGSGERALPIKSPIGLADMAAEALGAPKGLYAHEAATLVDAAAGPALGLYEMANNAFKKATNVDLPLAPSPGSRQRNRAELQNERVSLLSQLGEVPAIAYGATTMPYELVGGSAGGLAGARAGGVLLGPVGAVLGNAAQIGLATLGETAGMTDEERAAAMTDPKVAAMGVLGGLLHAKSAYEFNRAARLRSYEERAANVKNVTPKTASVEPQLLLADKTQESALAVQSYKAQAIEQKLAMQAPQIEAALSDSVDVGELANNSLNIADRAVGSINERNAVFSTLADQSVGIADQAMEHLRSLDPDSTQVVDEKLLTDAASSASTDAAIAAELWKQSSGEVSAILGDDPSALGSQESFAANRVQSARVLMDIHDRGAEMSAAADEAAHSPDPIARLQELRKQIAVRSGIPHEMLVDPELMFQAVEEPTGPPARTLRDSVSEYQQAISVILPKMESRVNNKFTALEKRGQLPLDEFGFPIAREIFVSNEMLSRQSKLNTDLQKIAAGVDEANPGETVRLLDTKLERLLRQSRINPADVGFRGTLAARKASADADGGRWLADQMGDRRFIGASDEELVALAKKASEDPKAPLSVFEYIEKEQMRRAAGVAPKVKKSGFDGTNEEFSSGLKNAADSAIGTLRESDLKKTGSSGPLKDVWMKAEDQISKLGIRLSGQMTHGQIMQGTGKAGRPLSALSREEPFRLILSGDGVAEAKVFQRTIPEAARDAGNEVMRNGQLAMEALRREMRKVAKTLGGKVSKKFDLLDQAVRVQYEAGTIENLPPEIVAVLREKVAPAMKEIRDFALKHTDDPDLRKAILANNEKYIFRFYNIFSDPNAFEKRIDTGSEDFKGFTENVLQARYDTLFKRAYEQLLPELKGTFDEAQIQEAANQKAREFAAGEAAAIVRSNLHAPGSVPRAMKAIGALPQEHYLISRVVNDPYLQKVLGIEKSMLVGLDATFRKISSDAERMVTMNGLLDSFRQVGLVSDHAVANVADVAISPSTLSRIHPDDAASVAKPIYVHPEVAKVLGALQRGSDIQDVINTATSNLKLWLIVNPVNIASQFTNIPQGVVAGAGLVGLIHAFAKTPETGRLILSAFQLAKELNKPGTTGQFSRSSPGMKAVANALGLADADALQARASLWNRIGLNQGGEFYFDTKGSGSAALESPKTTLRSIGQTVSDKIHHTAGILIKTGDQVAKGIIFEHRLRELMWKEGTKVETEDLYREAARQTLRVSQDPISTPDIFRAGSKSVASIFWASFAGFTFQTHRIAANSFALAAEDLLTASKYGKMADEKAALGDMTGATPLRAKARRYAAAGVEQGVAATVAVKMLPYMFAALSAAAWTALHGKNKDGDTLMAVDKEKVARSMSRFLRPDQVNSQLIVTKAVRRDGKTYVTVLDAARSNLEDGPTKILRILGTPGMDPQEKALAASKEFKDQLAQVSIWWNAYFSGKGPDVPKDADSWDMVKYTAQKTAALAQKLNNPFLRSLGKMRSGELTPSEYAFRVITGADVREYEMEDKVASRYQKDWTQAYSEFVSPMRKEWEAAQSWDAQDAVKRKYQPSWNKLMSTFMVNAQEAQAVLSPYEIQRVLTDRKNYPFVNLPGKMAPAISSGNKDYVYPLDAYLATIKRK